MVPVLDVLVGRVLLDRYLITGPLTAGGMSRIYFATDGRLGRPVCVKVFDAFGASDAATDAVREAFIHEAYTLSQLAHPNTLRIYDFGFLDQEATRSPFYVAELMPDGNLVARVQARGALSVDEALPILRAVAGALAEAHSFALVHGDVKPANVLIGHAGPTEVIKLADFGIASIAAALKPSSSRRAFAMYSPGWAPPEQVRGEPIGPPADVFGLALLWAYMRHGRRPLAENATPDEIPRALAALGLPDAEMQAVVAGCDPNPDARPFIDELEAALAAAPSVPTPSPRERAIVPVRNLRILPERGSSKLTLSHGCRLRLSWTIEGGINRLHVTGLNCFVAKNGGRASRAVDLAHDGSLRAVALAPERSIEVDVRFTTLVDGTQAVVLDEGAAEPAWALLTRGCA